MGKNLCLEAYKRENTEYLRNTPPYGAAKILARHKVSSRTNAEPRVGSKDYCTNIWTGA